MHVKTSEDLEVCRFPRISMETFSIGNPFYVLFVAAAAAKKGYHREAAAKRGGRQKGPAEFVWKKGPGSVSTVCPFFSPALLCLRFRLPPFFPRGASPNPGVVQRRRSLGSRRCGDDRNVQNARKPVECARDAVLVSLIFNFPGIMNGNLCVVSGPAISPHRRR